jgi:hypothetical protein
MTRVCVRGRPRGGFFIPDANGALAQSPGHGYWRFNFEYSNGPARIDVAEANFL